MSTKQFILSCSGLKNVIFISNPKECVKILEVGEEIQDQITEDFFYFRLKNKIIRMNRILAEFISPRVFHMHQSDLTLNSLELNLPIEFENSDKLLENFIQISTGNCISIDESMGQQLLKLSISLGNEEMYHSIMSLFEMSEKEINQFKINEYIEYIEQDEQIEQYLPFFCKKNFIDIISSHFYLIEEKNIKKLSKRNLYSIICNPNLKIKNEDSLLDIINEIFSNDYNDKSEFSNKMLFYEQIIIENLSPSKKIEFLTEINSLNITEPLWRKLYEILIKKISNDQDNRIKEFQTRYSEEKEIQNDKIEKIEYDNQKKHLFKGILFKLGNGKPINAKNEGIINITASSIEDNGEEPEKALEYENNNPFVSDTVQNSWLCIDFKNNKVKPSNYSIKSYGDKSFFKPKNWVIEGSNDNVNWEIIDKREEDKSLDESNASNIFEIKENKSNKYFQFLRIRQTGANSDSSGTDHRFVISAIEFFGSIQKE